MPYQTRCPNCDTVGLVRYEHVITGTAASKLFYCGACEFQWTVADAPVPAPAAPPPFPKPRTRSYGPKRRG